MPWDTHSPGSESDARNKPVFERLPRRAWDRFKQWGPGGPGVRRPLALLLAAVLAPVLAFHAFTFRVNPDELGVVLRFGKVTRQEPPGLHFRMPYPIDDVRLPKVTRQNVIEIGMRAAISGVVAPVHQESLMLTGDENIVDMSVVVYWRIRDPLEYLFNIQHPEQTVQDVAESAVREVVGQSSIAPLLTAARLKTELAVQKLAQGVLDHYGAGIRIDRVQLQRIDPPTQVIDAFRDVQAAATDKETLQNEALAYASRIVPEARGEAQRILLTAKGFQLQTVAEATGQSARFLKVREQYEKAPEVTRLRLYLETMERVIGNATVIIVDSKAVVPFVSLGPRPPTERKQP